MNRVLICGDRNWDDYEAIDNFVKKLPVGSVVIQGMCRGADMMARQSALKYGFEVEDYPADWFKLGNAAGPIRNKQMLDEGKPDVVFAFHKNFSQSKGTRNMIEQANKQNIPFHILTEYIHNNGEDEK